MSNSHSSQSLHQVLWSTWINWGAFRITFGKEHSNCILLRNPPVTPYGRSLTKPTYNQSVIYTLKTFVEFVLCTSSEWSCCLSGWNVRDGGSCIPWEKFCSLCCYNINYVRHKKRWNLISDNRMHVRHICAKSQTEYQSWLTKIG